jgi:hypothetical protein
LDARAGAVYGWGVRYPAVLALALAAGCVVAVPKSRLEPQERVAVEIRGATAADLEARGLAGQTLRGTTGVATAFMTGCLQGAHGAAPLALPVCTALGLVVAPVGGVAYGAVTALPAESVAELNATLGPLVDERELQAHFAAAVSSAVAHRRSVVPTRDRADAILALRLHGLDVQQHSGDRVSLRITAAARVETGGEDPGKPRAPWRAAEHETPPRPFRDWVSSEGRALLDDLDAALEAIAADVVRAALRPQEFGEARS